MAGYIGDWIDRTAPIIRAAWDAYRAARAAHEASPTPATYAAMEAASGEIDRAMLRTGAAADHNRR